tara:strand:+ start:600 stop:1256 length:657 start_codon:yes stop_codon:yes gene_type:complete
MSSEDNDANEEKATGQVSIDLDSLSAIGLVGDVTEEVSNDIIFSLLLISDKQNKEYESILSLAQEEDATIPEELTESLKPNVDFYISTNGGSSDEMFGIYDVMRHVKENSLTEISTYALGKVMSAGVLLLAAGTKGKRKVGKHCRIMIHSVIGGVTGPMQSLSTEYSEIKHIQDMYISALASETNMTESGIRKMFKKNTNIYLTAEEAVKLGIADEVF